MPFTPIFMTGGDAYGDNTNDNFDFAAGDAGRIASGGRTSTDGIDLSGAKTLLNPTLQTVYLGIAWKPGTPGAQNLVHFQNNTDGQNKITIGFSSATFTFNIQRNGSTIATSAAGVWQASVYQHVQIGVHIHGTTGWVEIRVNKVQVLRFDGQTNPSGTLALDAILFNGTYGSADDYVIGTGDWPGDLRVKIDRPTGAGSNTGFTPSTGSNWQNVDDKPANGDTDYNSSGSSGAIDTFTFPALGISGNVAGVRVLNFVKGDVGSVNIRGEARVGGTNYHGTTETANTTYTFRGGTVFAVNPATAAAWNVAAVDAAEFGYGIP